MKNTKKFPKNINITKKGSNVKNRIKANYNRWLIYSEKRSTKPHKSLTDYANEILAKPKYNAIVNLHYDFTGSKMSLTRIKHDVVMWAKSKHYTMNFENLLILRIKNEVELLIKSGQLRNSDKHILNK